jgi:hypothetical protein
MEGKSHTTPDPRLFPDGGLSSAGSSLPIVIKGMCTMKSKPAADPLSETWRRSTDG